MLTNLATVSTGAMAGPSLVAVVEDNPDERTALGRILRIGGFEVSTYASAEEFIASPPSGALCLLLDLQLDGMSGLDLLRGLRAEASMLRVIVNTASDDPESYREAAQLGCLAYLQKPYSGRALVTLLHELAAESRRL
jgi:FixJ family two-component response regulator